jgi:hypothetical protein
VSCEATNTITVDQKSRRRRHKTISANESRPLYPFAFDIHKIIRQKNAP